MSSMYHNRHDEYWRLVEAEDRELDARIAVIVRRQNAGELTVREAADARIEAMERHLEAIRQLRLRLLGGE